MMAELVQGQASVAQPGTKDDFADTIRRVRQVKRSPANTSRCDAFGPKSSGVCVLEQGRTLVGAPRTPYYKHSSCSQPAS